MQSVNEQGSYLGKKSDFELQETKLNGRLLYRSKTGKEVLKLDTDKGFLKYISNSILKNPNEVSSPVPGDKVVKRAREDFLALGLPYDEIGDVFSSSIMSEGKDHKGNRYDPEKVAEVVEYQRGINGIEVHGSLFRAFYTLEGKPFWVHVRWPEFKMNEDFISKSQTEVLEKISEFIVQNKPKGRDVRSINSRLVYLFDENTLLFEPGLVSDVIWEVSSDTDDESYITPFGQQIVYSFNDGIRELKGSYSDVRATEQKKLDSGSSRND